MAAWALNDFVASPSRVCSQVRDGEPPPLRVPGLLKGQIKMADDFDEWPDDMAQLLGMSFGYTEAN